MALLVTVGKQANLEFLKDELTWIKELSHKVKEN